MKLTEIFGKSDCEIYGNYNPNIRDLKYDSRQVKSGDLFFCISGFADDGANYAADAVKRGARAIVVTEYLAGIDVPQVIVKDDRKAMAEAAACFFDYPANEMRMIGVTGTNGKTTTTYMLKAICEQAEIKTGLIGTIKNMIGSECIHTERTTPESIDLQRLLRRMADEGCEAVVMEVSSHSLVLKRVWGIDFEVGIFTNLTQDHLDFHKTWDQYVSAKSILFEQSRISVVNVDDDSAAKMMGAAKSEIRRYSVRAPEQYMAENIMLSPDRCRFNVSLGNKSLGIEVPIPGIFTVYNALGAIVAAHAMQINEYCIAKGLEKMDPVPGRVEPLNMHGAKFSILLDYAHTPDSLENVLTMANQFAPKRLVTVFGCGGNRDAEKRPIMGKIAGELSDFTIITSDNPRFEEPKEIIRQIEEGIKPTGADYICIENRRDAIDYAVRSSQKDDVVILAGKGHEDYQEIKGVKHDFDEKVVVEEILKSYGYDK